MACGKPVISTNLPTGVPWVNKDKKTGLIVPPKDPKALAQAINTLLENENIRREYGENGKERVKKFTKELMIEKVLNLYHSI
jgi:rhamnosyl/mannosyltransferase